MIKITEKYYADTDKYNWILVEKHKITKNEKVKNHKVGDIVYRKISYYMNLQSLLNSLNQKRKRKLPKNCDLTEFIQRLEKDQEDFLKIINKMLEEKKETNCMSD